MTQRMAPGEKLSGISELGPSFPGEAHLGEACELVPGRLFFAPLKPKKLDYVLAQSARSSLGLGYVAFCVDNELVYEPYEKDFGPLNLSCILRFCTTLDLLLQHPGSQTRPVYFCCSNEPTKKANAAVLMGAFLILRFEISVDAAYQLLLSVGRYMPFRDASKGGFDYFITVQHCLQGIARASSLGWLDSKELRLKEYERLDRADLSWMVPGKILAFSTPSRDANVPGTVTPEDYVPYFKQVGIRGVVRLNKKVYERWRFTAHGFAFHDLNFGDGRPPPEDVRVRFLRVAENTQGPIAVHCKAGLGRTGVLVGCYLMKHFRFSANEAIAYMRIIRPGSVIGQQQLYLAYMEGRLWSEGESFEIVNASRLLASSVHPEECTASVADTDGASSLEVDPAQTVTPDVPPRRRRVAPSPQRRDSSPLQEDPLRRPSSGGRRVRVDSEASAAAAFAEQQFAKHRGGSTASGQLRRWATDDHSSSDSGPLGSFNRRNRAKMQGWIGSASLPQTPTRTWTSGSFFDGPGKGSKSRKGASSSGHAGGRGYFSDGFESLSDAGSGGRSSRSGKSSSKGKKKGALSGDDRSPSRGSDGSRSGSRSGRRAPKSGSVEWVDAKRELEDRLKGGEGPPTPSGSTRSADSSRRRQRAGTSTPRSRESPARARPDSFSSRERHFELEVEPPMGAPRQVPRSQSQEAMESRVQQEELEGDGGSARRIKLGGSRSHDLTEVSTAQLTQSPAIVAMPESRDVADDVRPKTPSRRVEFSNECHDSDGEELEVPGSVVIACGCVKKPYVLTRNSRQHSSTSAPGDEGPARGQKPHSNAQRDARPESAGRGCNALLKRLKMALYGTSEVKPRTEPAGGKLPSRPKTAPHAQKIAAVEVGRFRPSVRNWSAASGTNES